MLTAKRSPGAPRAPHAKKFPQPSWSKPGFRRIIIHDELPDGATIEPNRSKKLKKIYFDRSFNTMTDYLADVERKSKKHSPVEMPPAFLELVEIGDGDDSPTSKYYKCGGGVAYSKHHRDDKKTNALEYTAKLSKPVVHIAEYHGYLEHSFGTWLLDDASAKQNAWNNKAFRAYCITQGHFNFDLVGRLWWNANKDVIKAKIQAAKAEIAAAAAAVGGGDEAVEGASAAPGGEKQNDAIEDDDSFAKNQGSANDTTSESDESVA